MATIEYDAMLYARGVADCYTLADMWRAHKALSATMQGLYNGERVSVLVRDLLSSAFEVSAAHCGKVTVWADSDLPSAGDGYWLAYWRDACMVVLYLLAVTVGVDLLQKSLRGEVIA